MTRKWDGLGLLLATTLSLGLASCGGGGSGSGGGGTTTSSSAGEAGSGTGGVGGSTTGGTGGTGGSTGGVAGTTGGGGSGCDPANCPPPSSECVDAICDANDQCAEAPKPDGTIAATQTDGDCKHAVCVSGAVTDENDDADIPSDANDCTEDICTNGIPSNPPVQIDTPCGDAGQNFCDGAGNCNVCNNPAQCPGQDDECQSRTCELGVCGVALTPQGTATMAQTMGDCQVNQCDGNGTIETVADMTDIQNDANPCTDDACNGNMPVHTPTAIQTPCGPGLKCDGAGQCVGCLSNADCAAPGNPCLTAVCSAGMCAQVNKADGTACNDGNACTQSDTCQAGACTGANPVVCAALDQCHVAGTCDTGTGVCTNPNKANGASCSDGNACTQTDTCQGGTCTGANPVTCTALNQCHNVGTCSPATGMCSNPNKADGAACTLNGQNGTCGSGQCSICGNGSVEGAEACDDGNVTPCDGCSPKCQLDTSITYSAGPNLNVSVPDDGYSGTQASMACINITVPASGDSVVDYVCPTLGISHSWVGDLVIKLYSPMGTAITLVNRPGVVEVTDDGTAVGGDSSNLLLGFPIAWKDGAATSAENMGSTIANSGVICRDDGQCLFDPNAGAATPGKLAAFIGQAGPGTWKLCVGDGGLGDVGTIDQAKLLIGQ
ncbi:MAG: proprotein convertase P-domain-containing protein [Polyangiaceae bacterium]